MCIIIAREARYNEASHACRKKVRNVCFGWKKIKKSIDITS